ncbi:MAG TPA: polyprenyl synthetase family protein, partial [Pilimelia sp.]|nr:polyprenyl synthetase family protein [Pilimelia sp.]
DRFGASAAVLVGDLCLIWADRLMAGAGVPAHTLAAARRTYDQMRVEAVAGQYLDVLGESQPNAWTVERALCVARHKTASYTVRRPLEFGAALADGAGGQAGALAAYAEYGLAVGEAFQLRDDLLGVYGDPAVTGKPAGDDLRTGKPTTLLMVARELASPAQRAELDGGLAGAANHLADAASSGAGRGDSGPGDHRHALTDADVARLADLVTRTGAVAQVERMIDERVAAAITAIGAARIDTVARRALTRLAMVAARRQA